MKSVLALGTALALAIAAPASAAQITYTFTGAFDGTLNGNTFTGSIATFTGVGDTTTVSTNGFSNLVALSSLSAFSGGTTYNVSTPATFYVNGNGYAGIAFGDLNGDDNYFSGINVALLGYDGISNFGPVAIDYTDNVIANFSTDNGAVTLNNATNGTFSAVVDASAAVPEPATWGMMILGFGLVGAGMRRRKSTLVAA
jgi:hypothetical protein